MSAMRATDKLIQDIMSSEGFRRFPYNDTSGHATIGYGTLLHYGPVNDADRARWKNGVTKEQAYAMLIKKLRIFESAINRLVKVPLTQNQFDAICSLTYNIGHGQKGLAGSTFLKKLNAGDYAGAAEEFQWWRRSKGKISRGLVARRKRERDLFLTPSQGDGT